jgi:3,4-dihydroxy 2-butanone 4-phosphate synthase/GTP cyclohydrolase II
MKNTQFHATVEEAIELLASGEMLVLTDDEDRENEGDLVMAAEKITPQIINFMITEARGLVCCAITEERAAELRLEKLNQSGDALHKTNFLSSVDAVKETTTGISAYDRAKTIQVFCDPKAGPDELSSPGHMFPLAAVPGGVLERRGHTEAIVDLCELAGLRKAGVICEIINSDGTMARKEDLIQFARRHNLKMLTIQDIALYLERKTSVRIINTTELPTKFGNFKMLLYRSLSTTCASHPFALTKGEIRGEDPVLVRIHSECLTGDLLGSRRCDCGDQLSAALTRIESEGRGILIYLRQEGRGIGLPKKLSAYNLQQNHKLDTVEANLALGFSADARSYQDAAGILKEMGVKRIRLMTNNPDKIAQIERSGIEVTERIPIIEGLNTINRKYIETKKEKMGHLYE